MRKMTRRRGEVVGGTTQNHDAPMTQLGGNGDHDDDTVGHPDEEIHPTEQSQLALQWTFIFIFKLYWMYIDTNPRKASPSLGEFIYFTNNLCDELQNETLGLRHTIANLIARI